MNKLQRLSDIILEVLKDLSAARHTISVASLSEAFSSNEDIIEILGQDAGSPLAGVQPTAAIPVDTPKFHRTNNHSIEQIRNALLRIVLAFESNSEEYGSGRFSEMRERLKSCSDMDALISCANDLTDIIKSYMGIAAEEHNQVAAFARELGKSLVYVEKQLLASFSDTQDAYQANAEFNRTLQGEMSEIEDSFEPGRSLDKIRNFVTSRLASIRDVLESKSMRDEARFQSTHKKMNELQQSVRNMKAEMDRVQERAKTLEKEVLLDELTGIHNRRAYEQRIREELGRLHASGHQFSMVLFDVDHFKKLNDRYGHRAGDKCLKEIVKRVQTCIRRTDFLTRYGGEEFIILLSGAGKKDAAMIAEKARNAVEKIRFLYNGQEIFMTISLGVTQAQPEDLDAEDIFTRVDTAMYMAKNEGRNRVCVA